MTLDGNATLPQSCNQCPRERMDAHCQVPAGWLQPSQNILVCVIHCNSWKKDFPYFHNFTTVSLNIGTVN